MPQSHERKSRKRLWTGDDSEDDTSHAFSAAAIPTGFSASSSSDDDGDRSLQLRSVRQRLMSQPLWTVAPATIDEIKEPQPLPLIQSLSRMQVQSRRRPAALIDDSDDSVEEMPQPKRQHLSTPFHSLSLTDTPAPPAPSSLLANVSQSNLMLRSLHEERMRRKLLSPSTTTSWQNIPRLSSPIRPLPATRHHHHSHSQPTSLSLSESSQSSQDPCSLPVFSRWKPDDCDGSWAGEDRTREKYQITHTITSSSHRHPPPPSSSQSLAQSSSTMHTDGRTSTQWSDSNVSMGD